jgi:hypothetical protein
LSGHADTTRAVIYFFRRGRAEMTCETRLNPEGPGYQLVIGTDGAEQVEPYADLADLLSREHELLQAWRAQGWSEVAPRRPSPVDPDRSSGLR